MVFDLLLLLYPVRQPLEKEIVGARTQAHNVTWGVILLTGSHTVDLFKHNSYTFSDKQLQFSSDVLLVSSQPCVWAGPPYSVCSHPTGQVFPNNILQEPIKSRVWALLRFLSADRVQLHFSINSESRGWCTWQMLWRHILPLATDSRLEISESFFVCYWGHETFFSPHCFIHLIQ